MQKNDLFLRACRKESVERTPVWMMRQAGRYLPQYRRIRSKVDFLTLCKTPDLAAEVTLQPVDILGVDTAILFSDILVLPEAMGVEVRFEEKHGPVLPVPVRTAEQIERLKPADPEERLRFVFDTIQLVIKELDSKVPLIGFCGSPWTLATYMVEGGHSKNFRIIKELMYSQPAMLHNLLEKLSQSLVSYINCQIAAGAQAIQIFDTWGGVLSPDDFMTFSLAYIQEVITKVERRDTPIILFAKGAGHALEKLANTGADVVGLDWTVDIGDARRRIGHKVALQGNLDPCALYAEQDIIRNEVKKILTKYGSGSGHVFNLGHGILPDVPVPHAQAFVDAVKEESPAFHKSELVNQET